MILSTIPSHIQIPARSSASASASTNRIRIQIPARLSGLASTDLIRIQIRCQSMTAETLRSLAGQWESHRQHTHRRGTRDDFQDHCYTARMPCSIRCNKFYRGGTRTSLFPKEVFRLSIRNCSTRECICRMSIEGTFSILVVYSMDLRPRSKFYPRSVYLRSSTFGTSSFCPLHSLCCGDTFCTLQCLASIERIGIEGYHYTRTRTLGCMPCDPTVACRPGIPCLPETRSSADGEIAQPISCLPFQGTGCCCHGKRTAEARCIGMCLAF